MVHFSIPRPCLANTMLEQNSPETLKRYFRTFLRLPWIEDSIPGSIVENIVSLAYNANVLKTYDFIDLVKQKSKIGWQVKSTKENTPVTWKRAKIPNKEELISKSIDNVDGLQYLGNSIIEFCNDHAQKSIDRYGLDEIRYSRCIVKKDREILYFERTLATKSSPKVFNEENFYWKWSKPKKTKTKEQLPALHGYRIKDDKKIWAWHGHSENQLHFDGDKEWWNDADNFMSFTLKMPKKLSWHQFFEILEKTRKKTT